MARNEQVVVVGGGVVGLACALNLRRGGADVLLLDEGAESPPASWGNAGHLATEQVEPWASAKTLRSAVPNLMVFGGAVDLRLLDIGAWGPWVLHHVQACRADRFEAGRGALRALLSRALPAWRRLAASIECHEVLKEDGHLVIWESAASAERGLAAWARRDTGDARFEPLEASELGGLMPHQRLAPAGGIRFRGTGQVSDPGLVLKALGDALVRSGGEIRRAHVRALRMVDDRAGLVLDDGEQIAGSKVIVAAGVKSGTIIRGVGHKAPIIAERGYHVEGASTDWPRALTPVVFEDRSMIATRLNQRLRVSSYVEFTRPDSPADSRKWRRLERHVQELGLPMGSQRSRWMGSRPTLPDYLPAIGVSARASNLIYAFGHQHLGLTLAAVTGEIVSDLVFGSATLDLAPFALERFERRA